MSILPQLHDGLVEAAVRSDRQSRLRRHLTLPRLSVLGPVAVAAACVFAAAILVPRAITSPEANSVGGNDKPYAPRTYEARFAAFGRAANAADKLPAKARGTISDGPARHYGVNLKDTRLLASNPAGLAAGSKSAIYLARGMTGACLIVTDAGGVTAGCSDTATFLDGDAPPIGLLADGSGGWNVIAVLPNGASGVTALSNGVQTSLKLSDNVAAGHFADPPTLVSWSLQDGTTHSHEFPNVKATPGFR